MRTPKHRDISIDKLIEEFATIGIAGFDAETRFRAMVANGSAEAGLAWLEKLDTAFVRPPES